MKPGDQKQQDAERDLADGAFNLKQAMEFSGQTRTALYEAMGSGDLAYYVCGKHRMFAKKVLVAWMAKTFQPVSAT